MALATTQGKEFALKALGERRDRNKTRERIDNTALLAGREMHFDCLGCGDDLIVPENYLRRPNLCVECQALKTLGWLDQ